MSFSPSNQPFKDDIELKSDLRSDTLETRQEYDLKVSPRRHALLNQNRKWIVCKQTNYSKKKKKSSILRGATVPSAGIC